MAGRTRLQVGSGPWILEERSSATQITQSEVEEFTFSVQNEFDWLNEHMADVFSENQINVAEIFKTPGRLRGKTPRTIRPQGESRFPLTAVFSSSTRQGPPSPMGRVNHGKTNTTRVNIPADPQPSPPKAALLPSPLKHIASPPPILSEKPVPSSLGDSGYQGSQSQDVMEIDDPVVLDEATQPFSPQGNTQTDHVAIQAFPSHKDPKSSSHPSSDPAQEVVAGDVSTQYFTAHIGTGMSPVKKPAYHGTTTPMGSPDLDPVSDTQKSPTPAKILENSHTPSVEPPEMDPDVMEARLDEASRSPSEGSSPIRPIVRKSSLNFASLPAREPITHKSIGNRISRTSHLDQNRTSYYRHTGGKSLGRDKQPVTDDENDDMDVDDPPAPPKSQLEVKAEDAAIHNKTQTRQLRDRIGIMSQAQANVQQTSKTTDSNTSQTSPEIDALPQPTPNKQGLPIKKFAMTPGAFPEDDDDWIEPLGTPDDASNFRSPRPVPTRIYTADGVPGPSGKNTHSFAVPLARPQTGYAKSPQRSPTHGRTGGASGHQKSASVPVFPVISRDDDNEKGLKKVISASTVVLAPVLEDRQPTSPKSPSRGFNPSPLKQVKNKLSSILKSSRGLLVSSAAISAEGKCSLLSPSVTRLGLHSGPSTETLRSPSVKETHPLYPDLSHQITDMQAPPNTSSPERSEGRRTRGSLEKEKAEEKRKKDEAKEARRLAEQMEKLEKVREKEREKARVLSKEQERIVAMERQLLSQKEQEKRAVLATPGNPSKATKNSPQKAKSRPASDDQGTDAPGTDDSAEDVEMLDAPNMIPPPSAPRSTAPPSAMKTREIKRPIRPTKEATNKAKQAPTVIRVNMGPQHSQYHPSSSTISSSHDTLSQSQLKSKANQPNSQKKPSLQSLKSSTSSSGRPKALEAAARRKEQEEREAQRRRDVKAEMDRKRAALQEDERRQEQQRKLELERQKEEERKQAAMHAEAKKNAQRQAMLEKAKQTRAPPPAVRSQPGGLPEYTRNEGGTSRPPSQMNSMPSRSQDDTSRAVNAALSTASKAQMKRPLPQEPGDDSTSRSAQARNGNGYQPKESKRMRMTDELNDPAENEKQPSLKGAPVRPSGGFKKDMPTKPMFPAGYTNAPQQNVSRDLFKTTVTSQHNSHIKAAHPLDMAQLSKGAIPFAPSGHATGGATKTPGRPVGIANAKSAAKSATRSSPRFQNGESIELPEINTDDEDDDEDDGKGMIADWADSPNLRRALVEQENKNPFEVFGAPAPLNMEEVFARNKDRFPKFRARTSSANWSGPDGLTDEDIRKDLAAREKMRREGGWSYDMGREMV
ncbi:hypothetical protein F5Y14DRAFT_411074 [Nemania sp. NC0429]|nr:hypothetical protein F5Y14DRAFT_411074 [Nemania sp. NC0429]